MANTSNESQDDSVAASNNSYDESPPSLADQLAESCSIQRRQQRQLRSISQKIKAYENEPVKKLKLLNLDDCAEKLAFQKKNDYDTNLDILMELTMTEDSDNYDQTESDAFKVQQEFEQLVITLTGLQSVRDAYSHSIQSLAILRGLKEQPDITGVLCQMELKRARSALDYIRTAEINEELQAQLKVLETSYSELLKESDRQKRNQSSKLESVIKPTVMQGRSSLTMKMPTFDGNILRWKDFWTMFSARLENEPHLTDADKGNLLVQAITDPAARRRAEQLITNYASFDVGSGLVRDEYENAKNLYGHHFESAFKPDVYKDNGDNFIRLQLRIDATQRGLKDSKG